MKKSSIILVMLVCFNLHETLGQWATNGTHIYNTNTGYVGVGNNAPAKLLYAGKNMTEPTITIRNFGGTGGATFQMLDDASGADWKFKATLTGGFKIRDNANGLDVIVIETNSAANAIYIDTTGKIGIGTANPYAKLDVRGNSLDDGVVIWVGNSDASHHMALFGGREGDPNPFIKWKEGDPLRFSTDEGGFSEKMRITSNGQVGIGTETPANSAIVDMTSTSKGFLPPRMTQIQIEAISSPADGLIVYCTTDSKYYGFVASADLWKEISFGQGYITPPGGFTCGTSLYINHVAGAVAPVTKTTTYGTVTNIPGELSKCWITSNLGSDHQATAVNDATEASAGWYWQFNRMQGYKHDGSTVTPAWTITSISENSDWLAANDPCTIELGSGWRLPTYTEYYNVDNMSGWSDWNGPWNSALKMHAAGGLQYSSGSLDFRGSSGYYWGSKQNDSSDGWSLLLYDSYCSMNDYHKAYGFTARCLGDL